MTKTQTHFACAVVYRKSPVTGELEFLVIDSRSIDPKTGIKGGFQTKFPGGTNQERPHESVALTRDREVWEETFLSFLLSREIWRKEVSADHTQVAFLVDFEDCRGELRRVPMIDNGDELSAPYWVPVEPLGRVLYYSHRGQYLAACQDLRELGIL